MKITYVCCICGLLLWLGGCGQEDNKQSDDAAVKTQKKAYEAISLLGDTLYALEIPAPYRKHYDSAYREAESNYQQNPASLQNIILLGNSMADLHHYQDAIRTYTLGLKEFPDAPELYRYRGQHYITTRQFQKAVRDLEKSASLSKNMAVTPEYARTTLAADREQSAPSLQFSTFYHLGLAYYLTGAYGKAAQTYEKCLSFCQSEEETAAAADWLYMTYRRLGEDEIAEKTLDLIREDMQQPKEGYFERILTYKGFMEPEELLTAKPGTPQEKQYIIAADNAYGAGSFYMANGDTERGIHVLNDVIEGKYWVAFGYIAAEADLSRLKKAEAKP